MRKNLVGIIGVLALLFVSDIAEAQYGTAHRATRRRTAVVVASETHAKDDQVAAEQQAAADQKAAEQEEAAKQSAPQGDHLPYGII